MPDVEYIILLANTKTSMLFVGSNYGFTNGIMIQYSTYWTYAQMDVCFCLVSDGDFVLALVWAMDSILPSPSPPPLVWPLAWASLLALSMDSALSPILGH